ncbi:5-oxoprolinase subunit PxpA [Winogradskyella litorisediminis]|uniref:5-oxoprolinase subunit PxpA n=1 Tax=Winogradskyella litorisediminis TaxID=1156618 RepID=A0ABW3N9S1_9FLAO
MSFKIKIDINADVGEGMGNEALLIPYLSSCNIACGGHAGNMETMRRVVKLAKNHRVKIGAHPSFPDKENFGRVFMEISNDDLYQSLKSQIKNLLKIVEDEGLELHHIKPHGALYNLAAKDKNTADIIVNVISDFSKKIKLYAPPNSIISKVAKAQNIEVVFEGFADRNYNEDLSLVSRQKNDALITKKEAFLEHVLKMVLERKVKCVNGVEVELNIDTICIHGDTENAHEILLYLHENLMANNIQIK